jgi:hypothetical protein
VSHPYGQPPGPHPQGYPPHAMGALPIPPGMGRLVVDCSYTPLAFLLAASGPAVVVDGQQRGFQWGQTVVDLPPGQHHLHVHTRYMSQIGKADTTVSVGPGQVVQLYYRAPLTVFSAGALGPTPQSSPGMGAMIAIIAVPIVLVLLVILVVALA